MKEQTQNDKRLSLLQRCATYLSVKDLLDEAEDITHLMSTVHDTTEVDMNDNGNNADNSGNNLPLPVIQVANLHLLFPHQIGEK